MSDLNDLLARLPIGSIAQALGVDEATANNAVGAALPALLHGLDANAQDEAGAASLQQALLQHQDRLPDDGEIDVNAIDTDDGDKIVGHVFGEHTDAVASQLGGLGGGLSSGLMRKLLPMLAPVVMGYIAKRMRGGGGQQVQQQASNSGGGGLGDLLGGLLRSGLGGGSSSGGGGGLLDVLGGLLGGGRR